MEISININDSYRELCKLTSIDESQLKLKILKDLELIGFFKDWTQEVGRTIDEIIKDHQEYTIEELIISMFPYTDFLKSDEIKAFLGGIMFFGDGVDHPCEICGCEMDGEEDGADGKTWTNWDCSNPECEGSESNEPDWEMLPGGRKYF